MHFAARVPSTCARVAVRSQVGLSCFPPAFIFSSRPHRQPMGRELWVSPAAPHHLPGLVQHRVTPSHPDGARSIPVVQHGPCKQDTQEPRILPTVPRGSVLPPRFPQRRS